MKFITAIFAVITIIISFQASAFPVPTVLTLPKDTIKNAIDSNKEALEYANKVCPATECGTDESCIQHGKGNICQSYENGNRCCTGNPDNTKNGNAYCPRTECGTDDSCVKYGLGSVCTKFANGNDCCTGDVSGGGRNGAAKCEKTECGTNDSCIQSKIGSVCVKFANGEFCCAGEIPK